MSGISARTKEADQSFLELAARHLEEYVEKIRRSVEILGDEQLWWRPHEGANSVGNLLLHLCGNLTQWVQGGIGGAPIERRRGEEFASRGGANGAALLDRLERVVAECRRIVENLDEGELDRRIEVQTYATDVRATVFHAVEHMSYHTGQIVWVAKALAGQKRPIEFYPQHRDE